MVTNMVNCIVEPGMCNRVTYLLVADKPVEVAPNDCRTLRHDGKFFDGRACRVRGFV